MRRILKTIDILQWHKKLTVILLALFTTVTSTASDCTSNPCMYGICVNDPSSSYRCYCIDGYTGINCETNWNDCWSEPCLNGGTCTDAIASYNCTCTDGFVGTSCEQRYSECMNYPCQNNGTCLDYNGFACQCLEGFTGEFCEIDVSVCNNSMCRNSGECVDGPGVSFTCRCQAGWTGRYCDEDVNECDLLMPCRNGGLCINAPGSYACACLFGFTGRDCDKDIVPCEESPCRNNAVCLFEDGQSVCYCVPDYHGTLCESRYNDCESKAVRCQNGGTCIDGIDNFTCSCPAQYTGETCTLYVENASSIAVGLPTTYYYPGAYTTGKATREADIGGTTSAYDNVNGDTTLGVERCLTTSCSTSTESVGLSQSTDNKSADTTQSTDFKEDEVFTIPMESRTEYGYGYEPSLPPTTTYVTTQEPSTYFTYSTQGETTGDTKTKTTSEEEETTYGAYTNPMEELYTVESPESKVLQSATGGTDRFDNGIATHRYFSVSSDLSTVVPVTGGQSKDAERFSTTEYVPPATDVSTDMPSYIAETFATTWTPPIRWLTGQEESTKPAATVRTWTYERPTDADYDETITRNSITYPVTDIIGPSTLANARLHTLMTPSPVTTERTATDPGDLTTTTTTTTAEPKSSPSADESYEDSFTTLKDFQRTAFPTKDTLPSEAVTGSGPTTEYNVVHNCTNDQCANTSLCVYNGTQCDCSFRDNCRSAPSIEHVAFSGKSYIRQKFTIENGSLSIVVRLKTTASSGTLIHTIFDDDRYILLYMETDQLKFQFSCGSQTMLFGELDSMINNGDSVDVETRFQYVVEGSADKCLARLLVNNTLVMSGEQLLQTHETVPRFARLHLGGIPVVLSQQFPQIIMGFVGCMSLLKVNDVRRDFIQDSAEAVQIQECNAFLCLSNPCKNYGACEEINGKINCKCFSGFSGETCERSVCDSNPCELGATCLVSAAVSFICVCPLGTRGLYCEKDTTIVQPSFSVFVPGYSSYMAYGVSGSVKDYMELRMRIVPQTYEQISLIAYMGQSSSSPESPESPPDHFAITYVRGYLMLTWDLGSGVRRIFTTTPLNTRARKIHTLRVGRRGRDSWLHIDSIGNVTGQAAGTSARLDVSPILYIGGHKSRNFEILPHDLPLHTGFSGCIYDIELRTDDNVFPLTMSSPATGRGVGECYRNECSQHSCKNGAVCLNYGPTYRCICMKNWEGSDCSSPVNCTLSKTLCHKSNN